MSLLLPACGGGKAMNEKEAVEIGDKIISEDFPEMVNATKSVDRYTSNGTEFYQLTYSKSFAVEADGKTVEIPQIVVVTIDTKTGEEYIAVSD